MTSRHITAAEVRHQQRVKERERERERKRKIKREAEREGKKRQLTQRDRGLGIFSMMRFYTTTSSFLALLVTKSQKKTISAKFRRKVYTYRSSKTFFDSGFLSRSPSARLKKLQ